MSAKFSHQVYKVYEPGYHPHRTIILDEQIESPETLTIRLEEEAAQTGGDLSGGSPTGLLPMSAYKPQPTQLHGYADSSYSQYSPQSYSTQQSENAASQINQLAFAANSAATGQYLAAQTAPTPSLNVLSCYPNTGTLGTKISMKVTTQGDLLSGTMSTSVPYVSVLFGSHRSASDVVKDSQDGNGTCTYTITTEAPPFLSTTCPSLSNVPLTLLVENASGSEIARASNAGVFSYHDAHSSAAGNGVGVGVSGDTSPPDLGSPKTRSPVQRGSPPHQSLPVPGSAASPPGTRGQSTIPVTNTYGYPPSLSVATAVSQAQPQASSQSDYVTDSAVAYGQGSSNMLGTFRSSNFNDPYPRAPPVLRSPHGAGWTPFGNHLDSVRSPVTTIPHTTHTSLTRQGLTPIQHSNSNAPQLFRTSTLGQTGASGAGNAGMYGMYHQTKATLKIHGDLGTMAENWTQEEWDNKRRLVLFKKQQNGSVLSATFKPVTAAERPPVNTGSICISCIWWAEKNECFVTSVDTISLLEQLVVSPPNKFSVEEKNRIRRNLEGFHPLTVSKGKAESDEFFKVIMGFGNPKPRNIEKDVKVFPWKILHQALSKIISKYSASSPAAHSLPPSYPALPPNQGPGPSGGAGDVGAAAGYMSSAHHHSDSLGSPGARPLSGGATWATYASANARTMSPSLKTSSPISTSGLRITTLPAVYDSRGSAHSLSSPYSVSSAHHSSHHSQGSFGQPAIPASQAHTRSWEAYSVADNYPTHASHSHVYSGSPYGEGTQRA